MRGILKLHSADPGMKRIRIPYYLIESWYEYDGAADKNKVDLVLSELQIKVFKWGDKVLKALEAEFPEKYSSLVNEYKDLMKQDLERIDEEIEKEDNIKCTIIKTNSNSLYGVRESMEDIDVMFGSAESDARLGLANSY